ncbi:MAG TPA: bifunctional phosphopantothenoylcysteine decarboxylase/phosphopantothenate--cysteine ligase CoaBC [Candidatus Nanopelagicales bacterium]|nr:bifunctional phosphopantothenoylcysteine decarboxylase/phosphopantothenate--cysteine ligase CoaBC [Candidatus Nanopelagicales bacterium]
MTRVVLGVTGGIAAYKAVEILRELRESGVDVTVVPTDAALRFVGEATWSALSGRRVASDVWTGAQEVRHVKLGQQADAVVIAPATADFLARAAHGIASDLVTNVLLTATCPVVIAPAMHTEMWHHPATQANVRLLRERGAIVLEPAIGRLTGTDSGPGRLPDPSAIVETTFEVLRRHPRPLAPDLQGKRVLISVGGTREPWDDVRYLGNRSSGRQGFALARSALIRGALVDLVVADVDGQPPAGCWSVRAGSAEELREAMHATIAEREPDIVVMAAAVADFRPAKQAGGKITKESLDKESADLSAPELPLERTTDILAELVGKRGSRATPVIVGFAAEAPAEGQTLEQRALAKIERKGCDYLVANEITGGAVFGQATTSVVIVDTHGVRAHLEGVDKAAVGHALWDTIASTGPTDHISLD